uniref:Aldehyde dehydrogenase n=1 Tax=Ascaris lumbricoides TaxID=6252 RepID=A0A0M3IHT4_ASCLU
MQSSIDNTVSYCAVGCKSTPVNHLAQPNRTEPILSALSSGRGRRVFLHRHKRYNRESPRWHPTGRRRA